MARGTSAVDQFLSKVGSGEMEERAYAVPSIIDGTEAIPEDLAEAIEQIVNTAVERKKKEKWYTVYDQYGLPSRVASERLTMILQEKDKNGKPFFYARPPKNAPKMLAVLCPGCGKELKENPHAGVVPLGDEEDKTWREQQLLFPHMYKRHRPLIPRYFRDADRRRELLEYMSK